MEVKTRVLTPHQEEVKKAIVNALIDGTKRIVLTGAAGVGKTTCVNEIINGYVDLGFRKKGYIQILAPTNKAVQVLIEKNEEEYWKQFKTIHQALNLRRHINEKDGTISFKPDKGAKEPPFKHVDLVVIDEASMLNSELVTLLEDYCDVPIIFIGDESQLPPVNEAISPIFNIEAKSFQLTEIVRQKEGNPIIDLSQDLRKIQFQENVINEQGGYRFVDDLDSCITLLLRGMGNTKFLGWTNVTVNKINGLVRLKRYGEQAGMIEDGEILVMMEPYANGTYYTSQEVHVDSISCHTNVYPINHTGRYGKKEGTCINLKTYLLNNDLKVVHEDSQAAYNAALKKIKDDIKCFKCRWKDFFDFKGQFAHVNYNYASTIHKAQGSTYEHVIIDVDDLRKNHKHEESKKLWYTAITRASKKIDFLIKKTVS